jgi:hypothetical protein
VAGLYRAEPLPDLLHPIAWQASAGLCRRPGLAARPRQLGASHLDACGIQNTKYL